MKIHVPTNTIYQTEKAAYKGYRVISGGKAEAVANVVWTDYDIHTFEVVQFDSATNKRTDTLVENGGVYSFEIVALTAQEISDNAEAALQSERSLMIVTPWQFRRAINAAGKRSLVDGALSSMTEDEQDGWQVASQFERLDPLVIKLAGEILGYNATQIDNFFRSAADM